MLLPRWLPLIGWNLKDIAIDRERAAFQDAWRRIWSSNRRLMAAAAPALESLTAAGIRGKPRSGDNDAWAVDGRGLVAVLVLERDGDPRAVVRHAAVVDRDVQLDDLTDPKVTERSGGRLDGVFGGVLP